MVRKFACEGCEHPAIIEPDDMAYVAAACDGYPPLQTTGGYCLYCFPNPPCAPGRYCCPCPFPL